MLWLFDYSYSSINQLGTEHQTKQWHEIIHTAKLLVKPYHDFDLSDLASFQQRPGTVQRCWLGTIPKKEFECGDPILEDKSLAVCT